MVRGTIEVRSGPFEPHRTQIPPAPGSRSQRFRICVCQTVLSSMVGELLTYCAVMLWQTDKVDTIGFGLSKPKRIVQQIRELCAILSGLFLATDYKKGQELFQDRDFKGNEEFFQLLFELGRRYKIMNPDKMRSTYGKLIYLLQVCFFAVILGLRQLIWLFRTASYQKSKTFSASPVSILSRPSITCLRSTKLRISSETISSPLQRRKSTRKGVRGGTSSETSRTRRRQ